MKKRLKCLCVLSLILVCSACSTVIADTDIDHSGQTLTGQITQIDGSTLSLDLGKLKENEVQADLAEGQLPVEGNGGPQMNGNFEAPDLSQGMPQLPDDQLPESGEAPAFPDENGQAPAFPGRNDNGQNGQNSGRPDFMQNGQLPDNENGFPQMNGQMQAPDMVQGELPELPDGEVPQPDGQMPSLEGAPAFDGQAPSGMGMMSYTFKKGNETTTIDIGDAAVTLADGSLGSLSDLKAGDVVQICVDRNNQIESITVYHVTE